jgi:hypothetical protein
MKVAITHGVLHQAPDADGKYRQTINGEPWVSVNGHDWQRDSGHKYYACEGQCKEPGRCIYCDGGLSYCKVCGGGESSLPKECPGTRMTEEQERRVYAGEIDFRGGQWVEGASPCSPKSRSQA